MTGSRYVVKASLVAALASAFVGCGIASAQQSHSPFANLLGTRLQLGNGHRTNDSYGKYSSHTQHHEQVADYHAHSMPDRGV